MGKVIRKHIIFRGWVQGVGFRYYAQNAAQMYGASGWVRNEYDGSVTMEIQADEETINHVITAIERGRYIRIENIESRNIPSVDYENGFKIIY